MAAWQITKSSVLRLGFAVSILWLTIPKVSADHPGKHEVTRGEFRKFVDATRYQTDAEKEAGTAQIATSESAGHGSARSPSVWHFECKLDEMGIPIDVRWS